MITFTSEWDDGLVITTPVFEYDPETGYVEAATVDCDPEGCLVREYVTLENGEELDVCRECHEYVLKTHVVEYTTGKGIHEELYCPNCEE